MTHRTRFFLHLFFATLPIGFFSPPQGFCQSATATPPPPAHLPRLIQECETGPNYSACTVWFWHGSSYSAIWQNGAVGELTVASRDSSDLRITRKDSAGPVAGLVATYTGKWDGQSFSDGKISATLKGGTNHLTWTATPTVTPVLTEPNYSYMNWYTAPLTAYAIYSNEGSFNQSVGTEINDYRIRGEAPMSPAETRPFTQKYVVVAANYAKSVSYPQSSTIATIYADGTTFGDANVLKTILDQRALMIATLTNIETTLCTKGEQGGSIQDVSSALDKQHAAEDTRSPAGKNERDRAYALLQKEIAHHLHTPPNRAIQQIWDQMNQMRTGLAVDPVKDSRGNLVIPPVTPLSCKLQSH